VGFWVAWKVGVSPRDITAPQSCAVAERCNPEPIRGPVALATGAIAEQPGGWGCGDAVTLLSDPLAAPRLTKAKPGIR
jgi:hypothetical protein